MNMLSNPPTDAEIGELLRRLDLGYEWCSSDAAQCIRWLQGENAQLHKALDLAGRMLRGDAYLCLNPHAASGS